MDGNPGIAGVPRERLLSRRQFPAHFVVALSRERQLLEHHLRCTYRAVELPGGCVHEGLRLRAAPLSAEAQRRKRGVDVRSCARTHERG